MTNQGTLQVVPQSLQDLSTQITGAQTDTGGAQAARSLLDTLSTAGQGSDAQGLASVEQAKQSRNNKQPPGSISSSGGAQGQVDGTPGEGKAAQGGTAANTSAGGKDAGGKGNGGKGNGCGNGGNGGKDAGGNGGKDAGGKTGGATAGGATADADGT